MTDMEHVAALLHGLAASEAVALVLFAGGCAAPHRSPLALEVASASIFEEGAPGAQQSMTTQDARDLDAGYRAEFFARDGVYFAARGHWSELGGDFDGDTSLTGPDTIFVPDAKDGLGYELGLGWLNKGWAMELTYSRIDYDGSVGSLDADVEYESINWNFVHYLRGNEEWQPFWTVGLVFPWMDLVDASTDGVNVGDGELKQGFGFDLGLGLAWWLGHGFALDLRGLYTYQFFEEAEGVAGDSESIDEGVDGPSYGLSAGLIWVLGSPD